MQLAILSSVSAYFGLGGEVRCAFYSISIIQTASNPKTKMLTDTVTLHSIVECFENANPRASDSVSNWSAVRARYPHWSDEQRKAYFRAYWSADRYHLNAVARARSLNREVLQRRWRRKAERRKASAEYRARDAARKRASRQVKS
jgi:hypothetical protein